MRLQLLQTKHTKEFKSWTLSSLCSSLRGISEGAWGICTRSMLKTDRGDDWEKYCLYWHLWLVRTGVQHLRVATTHFFIFQAFCFCLGIYISPAIWNLHRKTFFYSEKKLVFHHLIEQASSIPNTRCITVKIQGNLTCLTIYWNINYHFADLKIRHTLPTTLYT